MAAPVIIDQLKKRGTETTVRAVLDCGGEVPGLCRNANELLSRLVAMLERKKVIRRGHVVELLCGRRSDDGDSPTQLDTDRSKDRMEP